MKGQGTEPGRPAAEPVELRQAYGDALLELGASDPRVVVLDADVSHHTGTHPFEKKHPGRFFQMGIAEQNMMGVAAGLAAGGYIPFTNTFAAFSTKRPHDQISVSIAYTRLGVKIVGSYTGLSSSNTGATHQCIDDIATMRSMPNMTVICPGEPRETRQVVRAAVGHDGPVYIRLVKTPPVPDYLGPDYRFRVGRAVVLREGADVALVGTGIMSRRCLLAAEALEREGLRATVLHVPTLKPLDVETLVRVAERTGKVVTVEDHSIIGGLGSAVGEALGEQRPTPLRRVGIRDVFTESAREVEDLFVKYGLTVEAIAAAAREAVERRR